MPRDASEAAELFRISPPFLDDAYIEAVLNQRLQPEAPIKHENELLPSRPAGIKIVYTPLHGTGNIPVRRVLTEAGYENVYVVDEQAEPDGSFPTVVSPNPEDFSSFALAEKLARKKDADLIICTDPDADRLGVAVKNTADGYTPLSGNVTGALLAEYLLSQKQAAETLPENAAIVTTIVSTNMAKEIAAAYGAAYFEVLTGFKYIGEKIKEFEHSGSHTFIYGFEESYGFLAGSYARDKDAVAAALLVCEAAAYFGSRSMSLWDAVTALYKKYGYFKEVLESIELKGVEGLAEIQRIMAGLRNKPPLEIDGTPVIERRDYREAVILDCVTGRAMPSNLPKSDVLYYSLADSSWICIRPSGTEPKIKMYFGTKAEGWDSLAEAEKMADAKLAAIKNALYTEKGIS
jgi:phosphoglucomutase